VTAAKTKGPWVVKLGGSLAASAALLPWLAALGGIEVPLAIVPGGGPFADRVRDMQSTWGFDESAAHAMALLSMEQLGLMLASLEPRLRPCIDLQDFSDSFESRRPALWLPGVMTLEADDIEESWDVTSDSLAAWLAGRLGARGLVLVKSAEPPAGTADAATLARRGLVDGAFARHLADSGVDCWCVGADGPELFAAALARNLPPGCRVHPC